MLDAAPKAVKILPDGGELLFGYSDGYVVFEARPLRCFDAYIVEK